MKEGALHVAGQGRRKAAKTWRAVEASKVQTPVSASFAQRKGKTSMGEGDGNGVGSRRRHADSQGRGRVIMEGLMGDSTGVC